MLNTDPSGQCTAFLTYLNAAPGAYHADLILDDCTGECACTNKQDHWKEYPYTPCRKVSIGGKNTPAARAMRGGPEVPNDQVGSIDRVMGGLDNSHPWGRLTIPYWGDYGWEDVSGNDKTNNRVTRLLLLNDDQPCDRYIQRLGDFKKQVETDPKWNMTYNPLLRNSNGILRHALEYAGLPTPHGQDYPVTVPGWDENLSDPRYFVPIGDPYAGLVVSMGYTAIPRSRLKRVR